MAEKSGMPGAASAHETLSKASDSSETRKLAEALGECHGTVRGVTLNCSKQSPTTVTCVVEFASHEQATRFAQSLGKYMPGSNSVALAFERRPDYRCGQTLPLKDDCCACHPRR